MPDAPDHQLFSGDAARRLNQFWQILLQNMQEFTTLRAAIAKKSGCSMTVWQSVVRRWAR
ncbi:hypothetical protein ACNKHK_28115 [Shigella flexneri]